MPPKSAKSAQSQIHYIFGHAKLENKNDFWSVSFSIEANDGKRIGRIVGRSICRNNIRSSFWTDMQRPSATTKAISDELFDRWAPQSSFPTGTNLFSYRWGCVLDTCLYGQHKGTGIWDSKLNDRCLFLLESLDFTGPESARTEVVHNLIERFSDHATDLHEDIGNILVSPTLVNKTSLSLEDITCHFRALGFRRVGDSNWLARSIDANHAARSISEGSDFDQAPPSTEYELFMKTLEKQRTRKVIKNTKGKGAGGKAVENSDNFKGYSNSDVQKLLSLRGITAPTEDEANQAKHGCTCGLCLGGFISPRMAYILSSNSSYNLVALVGLVECESHSQQWQSAVLGGIPFCGQTDITTTVAYKCWEYIPGDAGKLILTLFSKDAARGHYQVRHASILFGYR